ncbi:hypothetical protein [Deferrisoma camini]|uniref:hypothetical protein n=1 Tax=Deferrisoma camini TaxID=1035120 RepID=UPI00046D7FE3|nr:hypothetical protein [Deferrisoma camini]
MKKWKAIVLASAALTLFGCVGSSNKAVKGPERPKAASLQKRAPATALLSVEIEGVDYQTLSLFKQKLRSVPGVKGIYQQSFDANAVSQLQVEYVGTAQTLADAIQQLSSQEMPVQVVSFDPSKIRLRLVPNT